MISIMTRCPVEEKVKKERWDKFVINKQYIFERLPSRTLGWDYEGGVWQELKMEENDLTDWANFIRTIKRAAFEKKGRQLRMRMQDPEFRASLMILKQDSLEEGALKAKLEALD
jgi:hypothetical protein